MKTMLKIILTAYLVMSLLYPVLGQVVEKSIDTDQSWKCLDVEDREWTQINYNDSWWEPAANRSMPSIAASTAIWYPSLNPKTVYFRKTFEIENLSIISAYLYYGVAEGSNGSVDLYVNGQYIGKFYNTINNPNTSNIASFLKAGRNVIATKVEEQDQFYWSLSGLIRYRPSQSTTYRGGLAPYAGPSGPIQSNQPSISYGQPLYGQPLYGQPLGPYLGSYGQNIGLYGQNTAPKTPMTVVSTLYKGYDVTVDGVYVGSDGKGGDPLDGVYAFNVTGNMGHTIRVDHPWNWKRWSYWLFEAGRSYTFYF